MATGAIVEHSGQTGNLDLLKHLHEWERKNYWDAVNVFSKAMTFYLAIAAAVLGYLLTRELQPPLPRDIAWAGLIISTGFLIAFTVGVQGVLRQLARVRQLDVAVAAALEQSEVGPGLHDEWRRVVVVMAAGSVLLIVVIMAGLVLTLQRYGQP